MTIIESIQRRLRRQRVIGALLIALAVSLSLGLTIQAVFGVTLMATGSVTLITFMAICFIYYRAGSFSVPPEDVVVRYLDRTYPILEDSSGLFLKADLNSLEKLQLARLEDNLAQSVDAIRLPKKRFFRSVSLALSLLAVALLLTLVPLHNDKLSNSAENSVTQQENQLLAQGDVSAVPVIESINITVIPPGYTKLPRRTESSGSIVAIEMSNLVWSVNISGDVDEAGLEFNDRDRIDLQSNSDSYRASITAENRLIYRVMVSSSDTTIYSNYYSIDVTEDEPPQFRISEPSQFRTLLTETRRSVKMNVDIRDDFGVMDAGLNATLARGSGESVRFREQRVAFDDVSGLGTNRVNASIMIHADSLGMTPGDELYIYATATDNHPNQQLGRAETYMIVLEDTTRSQPLLAGNIQIDVMPEDFRSQRQIIVDTEELISEQDRISSEQFRVRSRRIGRDQQMLMLDFGQYMSMEDETSTEGGEMAGGDSHEGHDHAAEGEAELDGEGQETTQSTAASAIPEEFFHDHGSPEMNTLFAESPRALLRRALSEMFQASRLLQTDQPEEALAYEYRALEYLQEAQQADRRYVRRAGLDGIPIPVAEERFTGEIDDFANPERSYDSDRDLPPLIRFEQKLREGGTLSDEELTIANEAVREASISESDKLYLLNRINRLNNPGEFESVKAELLTKLSQINSNRQRNPSPVRVPVITPVSSK